MGPEDLDRPRDHLAQAELVQGAPVWEVWARADSGGLADHLTARGPEPVWVAWERAAWADLAWGAMAASARWLPATEVPGELAPGASEASAWAGSAEARSLEVVVVPVASAELVAPAHQEAVGADLQTAEPEEAQADAGPVVVEVAPLADAAVRHCLERVVVEAGYPAAVVGSAVRFVAEAAEQGRARPAGVAAAEHPEGVAAAEHPEAQGEDHQATTQG